MEGRSSSCEKRSQSSQQEKSTSQCSSSQHEKRSQSSQHEKRSSQSSQQEKLLAFDLLGSQEFNLSQLSTASQPDNTEADIPLPSLPDTNTQAKEADENGNKGCPINISEIIKSLAPVPIAELPKEKLKVKAKKSKGVPAAREKKSAKNDKIPNSIENANKKKISKNNKKSASKTSVPQQIPMKKPAVEKAPIDETKTDSAKKNENTVVFNVPSFPTQSDDINSQESFCIANIIDDILTQTMSASESQSSIPVNSQTMPDSTPQSNPVNLENAKNSHAVAKKRKVAKKQVSKSSAKSKLFQSKPKPKKLGSKSSSAETKAALLRLQEIRDGDCTWAQCTAPGCGKWRYLATRDPAEVSEVFRCRDLPDTSCESPGQQWDAAVESHMVETRFTVGSLVWARVQGWPAWPAMVDDDPDTGSFFWTELREGSDKWDPDQTPDSYHVVFFDKEVCRAWISDSRLRKFDGKKPMFSKTSLGSRMKRSFEEAMNASQQSLSTRRKNHCFAARWSGPWGPVWPDCGDEVSGLDDGPDPFNVEQLSQDIRSQPREDRNMSFIDQSFSCDLLETVASLDTVNNNEAATDDVDDHDTMPPVVARKSKASTSKEADVDEPPKKRRKRANPGPAAKASGHKEDKENLDPAPVPSVGHLYSDQSVFTQEMSEQNPASVSFRDDDILNSSLAREVSQALDIANLFTPVKKSQLQVRSLIIKCYAYLLV